MQQQSQEPVSTLLYRVETMERELTQLKTQLNLYVPARENDLRMQSISDTVHRIETELGKVKDRLEAMNAQMITQGQDVQKRDAAQRESQSKLQIRVLWGAISIFIAIMVIVVAQFIIHLFP